jgi:cytochrome-b5 reductase
MPTPVKLLMSQFVTHDVRRLLLERPRPLDWQPGQGIELMIDEDPWRDQGRPFTPTSQPEDLILELTLKRYPQRDGVTEHLHAPSPGAGLLVGDAFGTIKYQGPGTFIAAGTGLTPFLAILRRLAAQNKLDGHRLLLTNKSERDVICAKELHHYLGEDLVLSFSRENDPNRQGQRIDANFLEANIGQRDGMFYVCGPDAFVKDINDHLASFGIDEEQLVYER